MCLRTLRCAGLLAAAMLACEAEQFAPPDAGNAAFLPSDPSPADPLELDAGEEEGFDAGTSLPADDCQAQLLSTFQRTYHPFLVENCARCHPLAQGSSDALVSMLAFQQRGEELIKRQATTAHGGNNFDGTLRTQISTFEGEWKAGEQTYQACKEAQGHVDRSLVLVTKTLPSTAMTNTTNPPWVPLEWDLESQVEAGRAGVAAMFKVEARVSFNNGKPQGVSFRLPSLKLKTAGQNLKVYGLSLLLDGARQSGVTAYSSVAWVVGSTSYTRLDPYNIIAYASYPELKATTAIAFRLEAIEPTNEPASSLPDGGVRPFVEYPTEVPIPDGGVTFTELTSDTSIYRVFARSCVSCHRGTTPSGMLNLTSYTAARDKFDVIWTRMNSTTMPMPPTGRLRQNDRDVVLSWADGGLRQ